MSESHVIVVPTPLKIKDLAGTERMVREMGDYPLLIVPNMVPRIPPRNGMDRLSQIVDGTLAQVGPLIPDGGRSIWDRKKRMAITADTPPAKRIAEIAQQLKKLAQTMEEYGRD